MLQKLSQALQQRRERETLYATAEYWDGKAKAFSDSAISMWPNRTLNKHIERDQLRFIKKYGPNLRGKHVLDVGCGTGRVARFAHGEGAQVTGVDFSSRSLDEARRIGPEEIVYRQGSVLELEEPPSNDVVLSIGVLTVACRTKEELAQTARRLFNATKPGGVFIAIEPLHRSFLHRVLVMSHDEFLDALRAAGFQIEALGDLVFWPARLPLSLFEWPGFLTTFGYRCGQASMAVFGNLLRMGDYKGAVGRRPL